MDRPKQSLAAAIRQVADAVRRGGAGHLTVEDLLAYHAKELDPGRKREVQDHLALCHDCTRTVLDLASFPDVEPRAGVAPVSSQEVAAGWRALVATLEAEALDAMPAAGPPPGPSVSEARVRPVGQPGAFRSAPLLRVALAASVVLAVALGAWSWSLRRQVGALRTPRGNVVVSDLLPVADTRRLAGGEGPTLVEVRDEQAPFVLILNLPQRSPFTDHRVEIERLEPPPPTVVWMKEGLEPGPFGSFHLAIPGNFLAAGKYRFRLFGLSGEERQLLAVYEARIEKR